MLQWFRMYSEFATDTKVQSMHETLQRRFIMFMCLHCRGEYERLTEDELAFALRITPAELVTTKDVFKQKGFLDDNGKIRNWNKRQFKSDDSTDRVKKHRDRKRNGDETLQKRPQTQITDTDTDSERGRNPSASATPTRTTTVVVSRESFPQWWLDFRLIYPDRAGDQGWRKAQRAAHARISEGYTPDEFIEGANRYAAFCKATDKIGTEFVKQACSFLGPDKHFLEAWTIPPPPPTKADRRLGNNISAAEEFMRRTENA